MKILQLAWRGMVLISRDMLIGFIVGLSVTVLMSKINPGTRFVIALLIPAGIAAGIFKGIAKFVFLNIFSSLPSKGHRYNYPKYKILLLWVVFLFGSLFYSYGLSFNLWFSEPLGMLKENLLLGGIEEGYWITGLSFVSLAGLLAHFYEPPLNEEEVLKTEEDPELLQPEEQVD